MAKWDLGAFGIRLLIMTLNFILLLGGTYLMAPMLTLLLYAKPLQELFRDTGVYCVLGVMTLGLSWVMVGVTGWLGSCVTKNKICLTFNFLLAVSVLVTEVALLGVLGPTLADYKGIELEVNQTLRDSFSQYGLNRTQLDLHDTQNAEGVDFIQRWWQCCGYVSKDDWSNISTALSWVTHSKHGNNSNHGNSTNSTNTTSVPDSCCVRESRYCGQNVTQEFHTQGCYSVGYNWVSSKAMLALVFIVVMLGSQVCIVLFGVKLCRRLPPDSAFKQKLKESK